MDKSNYAIYNVSGRSLWHVLENNCIEGKRMITLKNVCKSYQTNKTTLNVLQSVSLHISKGEIHGLIGASGAGKSTLLRMINVLETPNHGTVEVNNQLLTELSPRDLRKARQSIGMIFQHFNLLANKTVFDNVTVPLELAGYSKHSKKDRVYKCLEFVGLLEKANHYPAQLSGGQKQRVAIARALANKPSVLLCDEPTSSLDSQTTSTILDVLKHANKELGVTIVIVSHEMDVIKSICHSITMIEQGQVLQTVKNEPRDFVISSYDFQQIKNPERNAYA